MHSKVLLFGFYFSVETYPLVIVLGTYCAKAEQGSGKESPGIFHRISRWYRTSVKFLPGKGCVLYSLDEIIVMITKYFEQVYYPVVFVVESDKCIRIEHVDADHSGPSEYIY